MIGVGYPDGTKIRSRKGINFQQEVTESMRYVQGGVFFQKTKKIG